MKFPRRSFGLYVPTWLTEKSDTVFLKRHVRNKYDPPVDEVELVRANPNYAVVRHPDGREATVSTRDLAPTGVDPRDQETSNDLVPTGSEVHLGNGSPPVVRNCHGNRPVTLYRALLRRVLQTLQGMNCKRHFIGVRRAPER